MSTTPPLSPNAWLRWDVVSRLLPPAGLDALEVGCGQGGFAARLARRYRYVGLEPDRASYEVAAARVAAAGGHGEVRNGDLSALLPDERFDLVLAFEVIEHIEDDAKALAEWTDRLRPGGWLILSTPATQDRFGPADVMAGHFRRYDPPVMHERLRGAGLTDIEIVQFGMPLGYALEAARNAVGRRRNAAAQAPAQSPAQAPASIGSAVDVAAMAERTGGSGRLLQPRTPVQGAVTRLGTAPFRVVQRAFPRRGPGLVARARKPVAW